LGVELRHLAALEAVATEGTFGRAAEKLGYTQSAVSQQIATLERIVGERLVERPGGPRPVTLTEAGRILLGHAESIVARLQAAQADLAALASGEAGSLHVGTFQSVGAKILPEVMRRFRAALRLPLERERRRPGARGDRRRRRARPAAGGGRERRVGQDRRARPEDRPADRRHRPPPGSLPLGSGQGVRGNGARGRPRNRRRAGRLVTRGKERGLPPPELRRPSAAGPVSLRW